MSGASSISACERASLGSQPSDHFYFPAERKALLRNKLGKRRDNHRGHGAHGGRSRVSVNKSTRAPLGPEHDELEYKPRSPGLLEHQSQFFSVSSVSSVVFFPCFQVVRLCLKRAVMLEGLRLTSLAIRIRRRGQIGPRRGAGKWPDFSRKTGPTAGEYQFGPAARPSS